ncbi:MAG: PD-(D/E)XK nuclease family protein [Polyangiaceae bacterium]|nr:PD-(D/E)XK nuclease family protein [Polyangiaceae bacterium]MCW5791781.1 PD-(D/E)XK nuclease family protein [Polyangiaceae bacterium]
MHRVVSSASAAHRLERGREFLRDGGRGAPQLLLGSSLALSQLVHASLEPGEACLGWQRDQLMSLAGRLAQPALAARGLTLATPLTLLAVAHQVLTDLDRACALGALERIFGRPGLPRALVRSYHEVSLADVDPATLTDASADVRSALQSLTRALDTARLATPALALKLAIEALQRGAAPVPARALLLDLPLHHALGARLIAALGQRAECLALVPHGDGQTLRALEQALGARAEREAPGPTTDLTVARLQERLFHHESVEAATVDTGQVQLFSAPGEGRECVEIARRALDYAGRGVRFERMAVLLRDPLAYGPHLKEACQRAEIPLYFARELARPDPAGRALLTLLDCKAEGLPATRFAEYLSLGVSPRVSLTDLDAGASQAQPAPRAAGAWEPGEDALGQLPATPARESPVEHDPSLELAQVRQLGEGARELAAPRRWERLLHDAAVIGGRERWRRRLQGLIAERAQVIRHTDDEARAARLTQELRQLQALADFALPLIDALAALPEEAQWDRWLDLLGQLAMQSLAAPTRVLGLLTELAPMGEIGPVSLSEVRAVLSEHLGELRPLPSGSPQGKLFAAGIDDARGLSFDVVFIPGLAEKVFPQKVSEDPLLLDAARRAHLALLQNEQRVAAEREALHLAVGAAERAVVLSYPRLDVSRGRPRVPSFYALEVLRAVEGRLPGFQELAERAAMGAEGRLGWPAPGAPERAIDDTEYDLSLLEACFAPGSLAREGAAAYLVGANPHLGRALRFRARRYSLRRWTRADGLIEPSPDAQAALNAHRLAARPYSATALQHFASCPYRFYLAAILRLAPSVAPSYAEDLDALTRGSLIHEVQERVGLELARRAWLPLTEARLEAARALLQATLREAEERYREENSPAILRVWQDSVREVEADLDGWLTRLTEDPSWRPVHFELRFGLPGANDPRTASLGADDGQLNGLTAAEPTRPSQSAILLASGIRLRGAIDVVERREGARGGELRATDYKTGQAPRAAELGLGGGQALQPLLYAEALAALFPTETVVGGSLYYCTRRGGYQRVDVPLSASGQAALKRLSQVIDGAIQDGFLPAAPAPGACARCEFQVVCGPYEELRAGRKDPREPHLVALSELRRER